MPITELGTAYELVGAPSSQALTFIHGLGLNRAMWQPYVSAFSTEHQVLIYDLLGHGDSLIPNSPPTLGKFSIQLRDTLDELDIQRSCIVGFSLGGMINRKFAMDYPERVSGLVILNSPHQRTPAEQKVIDNRVSKTSQGGPNATLRSTLERWFTPEFLGKDRRQVEQVTEWVLNNELRYYALCRQVLADGVSELIAPKPTVKIPALVMTCENDRGSTPNMSKRIAAELPNATLKIVPKLQHLGLMENPTLFIESIKRYLSKLTSHEFNKS